MRISSKITKKMICITVAILFLSIGCLQAEDAPATAAAPVFFDLGEPTNPVRFVAFSPDSKKIVTTGRKYIAQIWDAESGEELQKLDAEVVESEIAESEIIARTYSSKLISAAFSPDGKEIATVSTDGAVRIWDVDSGKVLQTFVGHDVKGGPFSSVISVTFSSDGKKIATAARDGTARIWDAKSGKELQKLIHTDSTSINSATFSPDGKKVLTNTYTDRGAHIWDAETGKLLHELKGHTQRIAFAAFSPDGKKVITKGGAEDNTVRLWDTDSGKELFCLEIETISLAGPVFISPDGKKIITTTAGGGRTQTGVRIWDIDSGKELHVLREDNGAMLFTDLSRDGKTIVTTSNTGSGVVRIWDVDTGKSLYAMGGYKYQLFFAVFSPDGKKVAITSGDCHHGEIIITRIWTLK